MRYFSYDDIDGLPIGDSSYSSMLAARAERLCSEQDERERIRGAKPKSVRDQPESYINWQRNPDANP